MRNQEAVFEAIYAQERWGKGKGSGTGSDPDYCEKYIDWLQQFVYTNDVESVVDVGCGDWQLYRDMIWGNTKYVGTDLSEIALKSARQKTNNLLIKVNGIDQTLDIIRAHNPELILLKDVMQHWEDEEIEYFLDMLNCIGGWKWVVTSNNWKFHRDPSKNGQPRVLDRYSWAPIPVDFPAFVKFGFKPIFRYPKGGFKQVMIAERGVV